MNPPAHLVTAVAYRRVSTAEQEASGLGLAAQLDAITVECERRGWTMSGDYAETISGETSARAGPAFAAALEAVRRSRGVLIVSAASRCTRSVSDYVRLLDRSQHEGWRLLALDLPQIDTGTATGRFVALTLANVSELERGLVAERTRGALAALKARGARLGRPRALPDAVVARVVAERNSGATWAAIAARLTADRTPTATGASTGWRVSTCQAAYRSHTLDAEASAIRANAA